MTPSEIASLQEIGRDIVRTFVAITVETFFLAIYAVVAVKATHVLLRKAPTRVSMLTSTIIIIMFLLAMSLWIIDLVNFVHEPTATLIQNPDDPLDSKVDNATTFLFHLAAIQDMLYSYMTILGDAVIIWRVYAFWGHGKQRWVLIVPYAMLLGSITASVMLTYCVVHIGTEIVIGAFHKPAFCRNIQTTSYGMATATTAVATILIGVNAWIYRRSIKPMLHGATRMTQVEKVMMLLVESGILYLLFFLAQVIGNIPDVASGIDAHFSFGWQIYQYSSSIIVGIYPSAIVVLAHSRYAVLDSASASTVSTWQVAPPASTVTSELGETRQAGRGH